MGGACSLHREKRITYGILVGKPQWERPLGRPICKWKDNIKMDLRQDGVVLTDLAQDRDQ
jgi:hypothetical protein